MGEKNFLFPIIGTGPNAKLQTYLPFSSLGTGMGIVIGGKFGYPIYDKIDIEGKLRFLTTHTSYTEDFTGLILDPYHADALATGTSSYAQTQSSLSLSVLARYRLTNALCAIAGLGMASTLSTSFTASQQLTGVQQPHYIRTDTHVQANGSGHLDLASADAPDIFNNFRGDLQAGIGTTFGVGGNSVLVDAELLVSVPLTSWFTSGGKSYIDSNTVGYLNNPTLTNQLGTGGTAKIPVNQPAITYPHLWYASLTLGFRLPYRGSFPTPEHPDAPQSDPISITAVTSRDTEGNIVLQGRVTNAKTGQPIVANLTTVNLGNNNVVSTATTDSNGNYSIPVAGPGKFSVTANANGYLFGTALFNVDSQGRILKSHSDIKLTEAANGRTRLLVFFEVNQSELQPSSSPELNRAVELMKAVPSMEVEIAGYTDATGGTEYNKALAQRRANAVRDFLVQHGVPITRIEARGYGADAPLASNDTDEGRSENRRVEFVVRKW